MKLVATAHFQNYQPGQEITDPAEVAVILAGESAHHVVKVADDPASDPAPKAKAK
jgi:hypothetical protein